MAHDFVKYRTFTIALDILNKLFILGSRDERAIYPNVSLDDGSIRRWSRT